jgi:hypothetical protein
MGITAGHYFRVALYRLRRNPVLTAMVLYSAVFGVTALMAAFAVWLASSGCPIRQRPEPPYVVQSHNGECPCASYC